ncbi:hypothetical protein FQZ97_956320 [compost metagenome]
MHEFNADIAAISALEDFKHLRNSCVFKTKNIVDEDLAVVIGRREAIGSRIKFAEIIWLFSKTERIEIGMQMTTHTISADHHDGANAVACSLCNLFRSQCGSRSGLGIAFSGLALQLVGHMLFNIGPVAIERRYQLAISLNWPVLAGPARALCVLAHIVGVVFQLREEIAPLCIDRVGIILILGVKFLDIIGIAAIEERGKGENVVGLFLPCHNLIRSLRSVSL